MPHTASRDELIAGGLYWMRSHVAGEWEVLPTGTFYEAGYAELEVTGFTVHVVVFLAAGAGGAMVGAVGAVAAMIFGGLIDLRRLQSKTNPPQSCAASGASATAQPEKPDFNVLNDSVVAIGVRKDGVVRERQEGSGFYMKENGILITCCHVIDYIDKYAPNPATRVYLVGVGSPIKWTYEADVVRKSSRPGTIPQHDDDPMLDLAILRITRRLDGVAIPPNSFRPLDRAYLDTVAVGQDVWVMGYGQQESDLTTMTNTMPGAISGKHSNWLRTTAEMLLGLSLIHI